MRVRGLLYTLTTACMFGLGMVLAEPVGKAFQPFFGSWLALAGGALCIWLCQLVLRKPFWPHLTRGGWIHLLLFASIGTALPLACIIVGLPRVGAIEGSFLLQLQTPSTLLFALLFLREKISWRQLAGMGLLLLGSLLVILHGTVGGLQITGGWGDLLVAIAAVGLGFSYIPGKRLSVEGDALQINLLRLLVGSCFLLPLVALQGVGLRVPFSWSIAGIMLLYIVTNFGLGYIFLQIGLTLLQAWEASAILQALPLFSTLFAVVFLHETFTPIQFLGGFIILIGGFLVIMPPLKRVVLQPSS